MPNNDCVVCDFKGPLAQVRDMSAYMNGYACPKCGVMQVIVKETKKEKQALWERMRSFPMRWRKQ